MATTRQDTYVRRSPRGLALRSGNLSRAPCAARPRALAWPSPVPREVPRPETTTDGSCRRPPACRRRMGVVPRPPGCVCVCVGVCGGVRKSVRRARRAWRSPLGTHAACRGWSHWGGHGEPRDPRTRRRRRRRGHLHCAWHHGGRHGACPDDSVLPCLGRAACIVCRDMGPRWHCRIIFSSTVHWSRGDNLLWSVGVVLAPNRSARMHARTPSRAVGLERPSSDIDCTMSFVSGSVVGRWSAKRQRSPMDGVEESASSWQLVVV